MIHYTQMDGLPSNTIYSFYQDRYNNIWICTDKGISKYNGIEFQNFSIEDGLPDNDIFSFNEDQYGRVWMGTYNGKLGYFKDEKFYSEKNTPFLRLPIKDFGLIEATDVEKDSTVTIWGSNQRYILSIKGTHIKITKFGDNLLNVNYYTAKRTVARLFELVSMNYTTIIDENAKVLSVLYHNYKHVYGSHDSRYFFIDSGLFFDKTNSCIRPLPSSIATGQIVYQISSYENNEFITSLKGLLINGVQYFNGKNISTVFRDNEHNYWIATQHEGIYKLSARFMKSFKLENAYDSRVIYAASNQYGFHFMTENKGLFGLTDSNSTALQSFKFENLENSYSPLLVDNYMYVISMKNGFTYNLNATRKNAVQPFLNHLQQGQLARKIYYLHDTLYILSHRSIYFYSVKQKTKNENAIIPGNETSAFRINASAMDADSNIWYATTQHTYRIKNTVPLIQHQLDNIHFKEMIFTKDYLVGNNLQSSLVICNRYRESGIQIDSLNLHAIPDKLYRITDSNILVATNNDYYILSLKASKGKPAYSIHIIEHPFLPKHADYIYADTGNCYFFENGAVTAVSIDQLFQAPALPAVYFTSIRSATRKWNPASSLNLGYDESRNISIYYMPVSLNTSRITYEYRISSSTDTGRWLASNGKNIDLFNITQGSYEIRLRAQTFGGRYSPVALLTLHIGRPFWLTWWFIALGLIIIALLIWLIMHRNARRNLNKKQQEIKFMKSEFTALNALMNPHFIFNSLNSIQSLVNKEDKQAASEYIRTISDLIRQNMHNVAKGLISLDKELFLTINYLKLEQLRFKEWLTFELDTDPALDMDDILVPPLLIQPLVENAIKHGLWSSKRAQGHIFIRIRSMDHFIRIEVIDNGIGFSNPLLKSRDPEHQSIALQNISKRLEQLSTIHGQVFSLDISERKDETGTVIGVSSVITIAAHIH